MKKYSYTGTEEQLVERGFVISRATEDDPFLNESLHIATRLNTDNKFDEVIIVLDFDDKSIDYNYFLEKRDVDMKPELIQDLIDVGLVKVQNV